jgi:death-on-curing protein
MTPGFLALDEVVEMHRRLIEAFGGSPELRDLGLLQSALAMPASSFGGQFLHPSLAEMAAAYLYHFACNHPFVDGNKRIAATTARVFLLMNGAEFEPSEQEYGDLTLGVAAGSLDKADVIEFFKKHVRAPAPPEP